MKTTIKIAMAASFLLSTGCGGIPLRAGGDFQPGFDFSQFTAYSWDQPDAQPTGDPRLDYNPFFVHRLHSAIHWELATRAIQYEGMGPALTVHHHASVRERVEVFEADPASGVSSDYGQGTQVVQYDEATFLVDISDARTQEVVWRGWAQMDVGRALGDPEAMKAMIDEAITLMFENFPVPYGGLPQTGGEGR
jgi:hypothetical protein